MGYKGTIRSISALSRSIERDARRRQAELERRKKHLAKMQELERAQYEVSEYENKVELLQSIHKECGETLNWKQLLESKQPVKPEYSRKTEGAANAKLVKYHPNFIDRIFSLEEKKRKKLKEAIVYAIEQDKTEYQKKVEEYNKDLKNCEQVTDLAKKVLSGDVEAYISVIENENPFEEIKQFGTGLKFAPVNKGIVSTSMIVKSPDFIPSEIKTLLKSGKLSVKSMPITKFNELYQDFVCSCSLRIARELFTLLPIKMAIINVYGNLLNKATGHKEDTPILSVAVSRSTLGGLNLDLIDPSDSMSNFVHKMDFKKSEGFRPVNLIDPNELI